MERLKKNLRKSLSEASTKYFLTLVGSVFYKAEAWGLFTGKNPLKVTSQSNKKFMKIKTNRRLRFLSHEEADLVLGKIKPINPQLYDICLLSLYAGLRAGECFDLVWHDVDLPHGVINIRNPKNDETRQAYITPQAVNIDAGVIQKPTILSFQNRQPYYPHAPIDTVGNAVSNKVDA